MENSDPQPPFVPQPSTEVSVSAVESIFETANNVHHEDKKRLDALNLKVMHPDEMNHRPDFRPWAVTLFIQKTPAKDGKFQPRIYYVRQRNAGNAGTLAAELWKKWEKEMLGLASQKYPDYSWRVGIMAIDDKDYMEKWRRAQKIGGHHYIGQSANPMAFTYKGSENEEVLVDDQDKVPFSPMMKKRYVR